MRKHDVRKWLHAVLDLLPVILIPVFMIYSHRHTLTERTEVEINYKYESNEVNSINDVIERNIYHLNINNTTLDNYFLFNEDLALDFDILATYNYNFTNYNLNSDTDETLGAGFGNTLVNFSVYYDMAGIYLYLNSSNVFQYCEIGNLTDEDFTLDCIIRINTINNLSDYLCFEYTDYNVIESVSVNDTNKDIMTVFMDDFNGAIDNYFNMGNVFNLNGVYQWFNTNIFSGNAPTVIYSIWNIALYELVMDLLFLLYGLFMWFIDMVEHLMEKPFKSIK